MRYQDWSDRFPFCDSRPSKDIYYCNIALAVAMRSTCLRRMYGAVIVKNDEIISTGYNGAPRGRSNCCDLKRCIKNENHFPSGCGYETCVSVHAEWNAIISVSRERMIDSTLYLMGIENGQSDHIVITGYPCTLCKRMIRNSGINRIVSVQEEGDGLCHLVPVEISL